MKQLTYRGIVYSKGDASAKKSLRRVEGASHTYRGAVIITNHLKRRESYEQFGNNSKANH